eukprot:TRINITY_DN1254_c0_g1_i1.p1 TRINITY_DN1254_c0_g1~~TRINITY_DN1254_c0_g1_i1.p1  ORF type:complete len:349 (+),score=125.50 TRINITY_DN1254_c0_g1_i1:217-1263(+)
MASGRRRHATHEVVMRRHENHNENITALLDEIGQYEKIQGNVHKYNAYSKAAKEISLLPKALTSGKEAAAIDGVGKKIAKKIDHIIEHGSIPKLDQYRADAELAALLLLSRITGVGPSAARKWVTQENVRSLDDLKKVKLNHHQSIGVKYFSEFEERIPRAEMELLESYIVEHTEEVDEALILHTCGSYRRGAPDSGDIDILVTHPQYTEESKSRAEHSNYLKHVVERLESSGFITDTLSHGKVKFMGVCRLLEADRREDLPCLHRRIDIRLFEYENYWCGLLYFTGSGYFNRQMRMIALERGYTLNESSICPVGETGVKGPPIPVESEEDVFHILGMEYREPEERDL